MYFVIGTFLGCGRIHRRVPLKERSWIVGGGFDKFPEGLLAAELLGPDTPAKFSYAPYLKKKPWNKPGPEPKLFSWKDIILSL